MDNLLHNITLSVLAGLTAFALTFLLTPWVRRLSVRKGWVSRAKEERWGNRVIARLGGIAMFVGFLVPACIWVAPTPPLVGLLAGLSMVLVLGLVDDLRRIPPYVKLLAQLIISCVVVASGVRIELITWIWVSIPFSVFWFVFCMNAFNLLDNMDGLAAGTGALAAGFCAWFAAWSGQWQIAMIAAILCGTCLGFLRFNFPPAKIYMGDSGSHFLGLSLAALAVLGSWQHSTQLLSILAIPMLLLAVPIFDTCFVTIQRVLHRRHPFLGGTDHVSHRLAVLGLSVRQTVLSFYGVSVCLGLLSVVSTTLKPIQAVIVWASVLVILTLFGLYLAQVKVYRLESKEPDGTTVVKPGKSVTIVGTMLMHKRRLVEILVDFSVIIISYMFSHLLRYEGVLDGDIQRLIVKSLPMILLIKMTCFSVFGLYRGIWRYFGLSDLLMIFRAVTLSSVLSALALLFIWRFEGFSRSVLVIDGMLCFLFVGGSRLLARVLDAWIGALKDNKKRVLVFGAGDRGAQVLYHVKHEEEANLRVVGLLDDDDRKHGSRIHGAVVLGSRKRLTEVLETYQVQEVLIAIGSPPGELLQHVRACCEPRGITWRVVRASVMDVL